MTDISIIVPIFNEADSLDAFFERLFKVLDSLQGYTYEIVCVNDGSVDNSEEILSGYATKNKSVKYITFSRNFGKEVSLIAGLRYSSGRSAIPMDCDLQDPPELILDLVKKWEEGYDVVYAVRSNRDNDTFFKRKTAELFYKVYNFVSERPMPQNTGDYRLISRRVIEAILKMKEHALFMKGIFNWVGFKSTYVEFVRPSREGGESKWNFFKLWNFAINGIVGSTTLPLRIWTYLGGTVAFISSTYAFYIIMRTLIKGVDVPGYASLLVFILFFGSIQLIALGVVGEYLGRVLVEVQNRPLYIVEKQVGFDESIVKKVDKS